MKNKMNRIRRGVQILILVIAFTAAVGGSFITSNAASVKWKKACKAYNTWLRKNCSKFKAAEGDFYTENPEAYKKADSFMIVDLNRDGVPELVTKHPDAYKRDSLYVFTYKGGRVRQVRGLYGVGKNAFISIDCNAAGWYSVYKCKKGHLHTIWKSYDAMTNKDNVEHSIYTVKNGGIKLYAKGTEIFSPVNDHSYAINGKKVGSNKYHSLIRKCGKLNSGLHSNTATNRRKYLR